MRNPWKNPLSFGAGKVAGMVENYQLKSQRVYPSGPGGDKLIQKESEHLTCMQKCCENGGLITLLLTGESFNAVFQ